MPSTRKKVLVRTRARGMIRGYLDPDRFRENGSIQLLSPDGQLMQFTAGEVKAVFFVQSFDVSNALAERRAAGGRPRVDGLWVRVRYHDNETLEGLLPNNLAEVDGTGLHLAPPAVSADFQRVYIPREAIAEAVVLGIIGGQRRTRRAAPVAQKQIDLFVAEPAAPVSPGA